MFGAAAIRCLQAATAAFTAGLLAIAEPPEEDEALLDDAAAVVLELVAGADDEDAVLEEELLLPHPPITAATASSAESFLIMADTLAVRRPRSVSFEARFSPTLSQTATKRTGFRRDHAGRLPHRRRELRSEQRDGVEIIVREVLAHDPAHAGLAERE